jgi:integrase
MASIHRDPRSKKGVWYCSFTLASGQRVCRSTKTKSRAEAKVLCESWQEAERSAASGSLSTFRATELINETLRRCGQEPVERVRLGTWLSEWLASKANVTLKVRNRYQFASEALLSFLGAESERRFLDSISAAEIRRFATHLSAQGRCGATVNRIVHTELGNAFNRAVRLGKIRFSPIAAVEPLKDGKQLVEHKTFTPEQVALLVKTSGPDSDWAGAILFAYSCGARLQDVANLRWDSIDLTNQVVSFRQRKLTGRKSGAEVVVGLHLDFERWLLKVTLPDDPNAYVFPSLANRAGGGKAGLSTQFSDLVANAGIEAGLIRERHGAKGRSRRNLSFHSLRHGAASQIFNSAVIKESARAITGHAKGGSLERYLHRDLEAIRAATALIPRLPL